MSDRFEAYESQQEQANTVIAKLAKMTGDMALAERTYRYERLPVFGMQTMSSLVRLGRTEALLRFLDRVDEEGKG